MSNIVKIPEIKIQTANKVMLSSKKKGNITGLSNYGERVNINDCLILGNLSHNLISVMKLNEKGFKVEFDRCLSNIDNGETKVKFTFVSPSELIHLVNEFLFIQ